RRPAARLRDPLEHLPEPFEAGRLLPSQVGLGDDPHQAVAVLDDRDPPDLLPLHDPGHLFDIGVRRHGADVAIGHVIAHPALLLVTLGYVPDRDVAVGDDAAQTHTGGVVHDGDDADVGVPHELGGTAHRVVGRDDLDVRGHDVAGLHVRAS